jgi:hypothetical protein
VHHAFATGWTITSQVTWRILIIWFTLYRCAPISTDNTFQDLLQLRETVDNTERYIQHDIRVTNINVVKFNWQIRAFQKQTLR